MSHATSQPTDSNLRASAADEASPRRASTLSSRRDPLASPAEQLRVLRALALSAAPFQGDFERALASAGQADGLRALPLRVLQVNVGKLCNMTCAHCHVDAGPDRTDAVMSRATMEACLAALDRSGAQVVDITGGAPELHPHFRWFVDECARRGRHVIDRCNLTVLLLPRSAGLPEFLAERGVEVACSLPHPRRPNTDAQRGDGAFERSIEALRLLNEAGYGQGDPRCVLTLVSNPAGAFLGGDQASMERDWARELRERHGVTFDRLSVLNNMPIARFLEWLLATRGLEAYLERLLAAWNPATVPGLMCRDTASVSWDGRVFDCDFNQMLDIEARDADGRAPRIEQLDAPAFARRRIRTDRHCFGCTAGAGSSCGGALDGGR